MELRKRSNVWREAAFCFALQGNFRKVLWGFFVPASIRDRKKALERNATGKLLDSASAARFEALSLARATRPCETLAAVRVLENAQLTGAYKKPPPSRVGPRGGVCAAQNATAMSQAQAVQKREPTVCRRSQSHRLRPCWRNHDMNRHIVSKVRVGDHDPDPIALVRLQYVVRVRRA